MTLLPTHLSGFQAHPEQEINLTPHNSHPLGPDIIRNAGQKAAEAPNRPNPFGTHAGEPLRPNRSTRSEIADGGRSSVAPVAFGTDQHTGKS